MGVAVGVRGTGRLRARGSRGRAPLSSGEASGDAAAGVLEVAESGGDRVGGIGAPGGGAAGKPVEVGVEELMVGLAGQGRDAQELAVA